LFEQLDSRYWLNDVGIALSTEGFHVRNLPIGPNLVMLEKHRDLKRHFAFTESRRAECLIYEYYVYYIRLHARTGPKYPLYPGETSPFLREMPLGYRGVFVCKWIDSTRILSSIGYDCLSLRSLRRQPFHPGRVRITWIA
jgi:hypothetical protein